MLARNSLFSLNLLSTIIFFFLLAKGQIFVVWLTDFFPNLFISNIFIVSFLTGKQFRFSCLFHLKMVSHNELDFRKNDLGTYIFFARKCYAQKVLHICLVN